ncbi:complement C3-like isoform X2 [Mobula hypostoma]|uniref:complement C3-like isoform X2 n=1 Tax=Mobula hypostoma TaxID=723540 RepID=UPI002FC30E11
MAPLTVLLLISSWVSFTEPRLPYLITAPKVIRIDVKESITVQVFGAQGNVNATVYFINQKTLRLCSDKYSVQLNHTNKFIQDLLVQILPEKVEECKLRGTMSYIVMATEMPELFPNRMITHLHLRAKPYFIFIETNKPIYRPGETVYFRSFTLDHALKLTDCEARLKILNADVLVNEVESRREGSGKVCKGEIRISPSKVGDFEIQAVSKEYAEYNGHRKFRVNAAGEEESLRNDEEVTPYVINLSKMKRFFIPGGPFRIQAIVTHQDYSPVAKAPIEISVMIKERKTIQASQGGFTDNYGEMSLTFNVPEDASEIYVTVTAGTKASGTERKSEMAIKSHQSSRAYLYIEAPNVLLYPGDSIEVNLTALGLTDGSNVDHYYYMILNKGNLIHYETIERSTNTSFLVNITQDMVPYFRIVAYYLVDINGVEELISDSVRLEVEDLCDLKFQMVPRLLEEKNKRDLLLSVFTNSTASVYVQVVDGKLSRAHVDLDTYRQVFYRKDLYDFGISYGGGRNTAEVFKDSGLRYISDLMPELQLIAEPTTVPWQRSPLQPQRNDITATSTFPRLQPLFKQAWMWEIQETTGAKTFRLTLDISSPNLWEISAFSILEDGELCVAKPLMVKISNKETTSHRRE